MAQSNKAKGDESEARAQLVLEAEGYAVCRTWRQYSMVGPGRVISMQADFFGAFDLIAIKPGERIRFIQVKWTNGAPWAAAVKVFNESAPDGGWPPEHMTTEIWWDRKTTRAKAKVIAERTGRKTMEVFREFKRYEVKTAETGFTRTDTADVVDYGIRGIA